MGLRFRRYRCQHLRAALGAERSNSEDSHLPHCAALIRVRVSLLQSGRGSVWAVVLGALVIGSIANGLTLMSQPPDVQQIVEGAVLIVAVTADALLRRRSAISGR